MRSVTEAPARASSTAVPYFGCSSAAQREAYRREFARTRKLLPTEGHDVVIDVQHMVVGVITVVMVGTGCPLCRGPRPMWTWFAVAVVP